MGATASIMLHGAVLLFLFYYMLTTPVPPYPEGGGVPGMGVEVNLGFSDDGSGLFQEIAPSLPEQTEIPVVQKASHPAGETEETKLLTSGDNEAEAIAAVKNKKENIRKKEESVVKKTITSSAEEKKEKTTAEETEVKREVNVRALYKRNTGDVSSQGDGTGTGDKGNPAGNPFSTSYTGNGTGGDGSGPGAGGGTGGGFGTGVGTGVGSGVSFRLEGRVKQYLPYPEKVKNRAGIVVVEIKVDRQGNVVDAVPGAKGSTTLDENLLRAAREAALKTKFERKPDAPEFQKGYITYNFVLE